MHYAFKDMEWVDLGETGWSRASVTLDEGDSAVNPASGKPENVLRGPAVVTYDRHRTGINVHVEDVPS
jgi:hypothetical protein